MRQLAIILALLPLLAQIVPSSSLCAEQDARADNAGRYVGGWRVGWYAGWGVFVSRPAVLEIDDAQILVLTPGQSYAVPAGAGVLVLISDVPFRAALCFPGERPSATCIALPVIGGP